MSFGWYLSFDNIFKGPHPFVPIFLRYSIRKEIPRDYRSSENTIKKGSRKNREIVIFNWELIFIDFLLA